MRRTAIAAALAPLLGSCTGSAPPLPQWTVIVATDAPVPQLGDRLQIDVLDDAGQVACSSCQRQLAADDAKRWPISFGVVAGGGTRRVRARLFRTALIGPEGTPTPPALVDRVVKLPATTTDLHVAVVLPMKCFGVPANITSGLSCDPETGALAPEVEAAPAGSAALPAVGSWPPALAAPCTGDTPADMVCVPGGAFLLGDPAAVPVGSPELAQRPEHLVTLAPFRLDRDELTVQAYLDLKASHPGLPEPSAHGDPTIQDSKYCTYQGPDPKMPLNCVSRVVAAAICTAQGKRLPREVEWEYAAGNLSRETPYPWGADDDVCTYAVVARDDISGPSLCRVKPPPQTGTYPVGPAAGGLPADTTDLGVRNLAGNVSEWVADDFAAYTDPCWSGPSPLDEPTCSVPSSTLVSLRGGNWQSVPLEAVITTRKHGAPSLASPLVGVRCARD